MGWSYVIDPKRWYLYILGDPILGPNLKVGYFVFVKNILNVISGAFLSFKKQNSYRSWQCNKALNCVQVHWAHGLPKSYQASQNDARLTRNFKHSKSVNVQYTKETSHSDLYNRSVSWHLIRMNRPKLTACLAKDIVKYSLIGWFLNNLEVEIGYFMLFSFHLCKQEMSDKTQMDGKADNVPILFLNNW